jgi:DNA-binding IclR family transcriptional regulator
MTGVRRSDVVKLGRHMDRDGVLHFTETNLRHMIVVALSQTQAPVRLHVDIGSRFPTLISATGRCVAAFSRHPPEEIERRFRALRWNNAPTYATWRKEVEATRRQGFSIDRGNYIAGVTMVGSGARFNGHNHPAPSHRSESQANSIGRQR